MFYRSFPGPRVAQPRVDRSLSPHQGRLRHGCSTCPKLLLTQGSFAAGAQNRGVGRVLNATCGLTVRRQMGAFQRRYWQLPCSGQRPGATGQDWPLPRRVSTNFSCQLHSSTVPHSTPQRLDAWLAPGGRGSDSGVWPKAAKPRAWAAKKDAAAAGLLERDQNTTCSRFCHQAPRGAPPAGATSSGVK